MTYDRIQEDPETLRDCAVWEVFEELGNDTIADLIKDQYRRNLEDYKLVHEKARAEVRSLVSKLTDIIDNLVHLTNVNIPSANYASWNQTVIDAREFLAEKVEP